MSTEFIAEKNLSEFQGQSTHSLIGQSDQNQLEDIEASAADSLSTDSATLFASELSLDENAEVHAWNDFVLISALSVDRSIAELEYTRNALSVKGGRSDSQIDYDPLTGVSEQVILDFRDPILFAQVELGWMRNNEWQNLPETGKWLAYDDSGNELGSGTLNPQSGQSTGRNKYQFEIDPSSEFSRLVLEATAYGDGEGTERMRNNSDFNLRSLTYTFENAPNEDMPDGANGADESVIAPDIAETIAAGSSPDTVAETIAEEDSSTSEQGTDSQVLSAEPVRLEASEARLNRRLEPQQWDENVIVSGIAADGSPAKVVYGLQGLAVKTGRYAKQIDFDPNSGQSEKLVLDFSGPVYQAAIEVGFMNVDEWQGLAETGRWTTYDAEGYTVASGVLDPTTVSSSGDTHTFEIDSLLAFEKLVIEATAYGNGAGSDRISNNSDFNLRSLTYTLDAAPDDTSDGNAGGDSMSDDDVPSDTSGDDTGDVADDTDNPSDGDHASGDSDSHDNASDDSGNTNDDADTTGDDMDGDLSDRPTDDTPGTVLWSDLNHQANDSVVIAAGQTVILNQDTANLAGVIVDGGHFIFSEDFTDTNGNGELDFTADWLLVRNGGYLEIGTEADPYEANATITLDGADEDVMNMGMGGRFLMASGAATDGTESTISMHGIAGEKVSWTQLSAHADVGDTTITLADPVDWQVGDEIAIAPSGFDAYEAEKRMVVAVSADGQTVTLDRALEYEHWGAIETIDGKPLDMRAEVGLLSRNITVASSDDAQDTNFGFHAMFMPNSDIRIAGVEFEGGGQTGNQGRYPVHWHQAGDADGDYIKDSSIHSSFHRGIVLHGTNNVTVDSNVVYDVFSHAYTFAEDGTEFNNTLTNNLGMLVKRLEREEYAFPVDNHFTSGQAEHRASVFWGRNYYNSLVGNHAAGTEDGNGFYFDSQLLSHQTTQAMVKSDAPIVFTDNVSHSNQTYFDFNPNYGPRTRGNGLQVDRFGGDSGSELRFENFTTYKNENNGVWIENARHVLSNAMIADSSAGVLVLRSTIEDTVITQKSPNTIGGVLGVDRPILANAGALGGGIFLFGTPWGVEPTIRDVTFVDIDPAAITVHKRANLGNDSTISGVKLVNTQALLWDIDERQPVSDTGVLIDQDGSLTGTGVATAMSGYPLAGEAGFVEDFNAYVLPEDVLER